MRVIFPSQGQSFKSWLVAEEVSEKAGSCPGTCLELSYWNALQRSSGLTQDLLEPFGSSQPLLSSRLHLFSSTFLFKKYIYG